MTMNSISKNIIIITISLTFSVICIKAQNEVNLSEKAKIQTNLFLKGKEPQALEMAIDLVNSQPSHDVEETLTKNIRFFESIVSVYEIDFEEEKLPPVKANLSPGPGYDSGISPKDVSDPLLRADYEKRILENHENAKRKKIQLIISKLVDNIVSLTILSKQDNLSEAKKLIESIKVSRAVQTVFIRKIEVKLLKTGTDTISK